MHATTGGLILVAHNEWKIRDVFLAAPLGVYMPHTPTEPDVVRRLLAGVREHGHVVCKEYVTLGAMGVGVPVWSSHGTVIAALTVGVAVKDARPMMYAPALAVATQGITRALTSLPPPRQLSRFFPAASTVDA